MFQGYKATADSNFVKCLNKKEEDYIDGIKDIEFKEIMQLALNKYIFNKKWRVGSSFYRTGTTNSPDSRTIQVQKY